MQTGQPLYKPIIKRGPINKRKEDNISIGEYLYNSRVQKMKAQQDQVLKEHIRMEGSKFRASNKTNKIIDQKRIQKLEEIFQLLDSDEDGLISATNIDITKVPMEVLEIYAPFLSEMEELNIVLDLPSFIEASDKLIKVLKACPILEFHLFLLEYQRSRT